MRGSCLPAGLRPDEAPALDRAVAAQRRLARGEYLYRAGAPLETVFAVRSGFLKSSVMHEDGREQVTAFHMAGDLLGLDGIASGLHGCDAAALDDCEICELPYPRLETLARSIPALMRHFHRLMSREIVRDHGVMLVLGSMRAESRVAAFLIDLAERRRARGFPAHVMVLAMTRAEIGSYLGLKLETVSRALSRFQEQKAIVVRHRHLQILDEALLRQRIGPAAPVAPR